jgi:hypothetical protein
MKWTIGTGVIGGYIATGLRAGQIKGCGAISWKGNIFFFFANGPDLLWGQANFLLDEQLGCLLTGKSTGLLTWLLTSISCRVEK